MNNDRTPDQSAEPAPTGHPPHHIEAALAKIIAGHRGLAAAVNRTAGKHGTRRTAAMLGVSHQTVQRWKRASLIPGADAMADALASVRKNGAGA